MAVKTHIWKGPKAFKISQIRPVQGGGMRRSYSSRDYDRAVLVVRRPEEALLAEYNRRNTGDHTGRVDDSMLQVLILVDNKPLGFYVKTVLLRQSCTISLS